MYIVTRGRKQRDRKRCARKNAKLRQKNRRRRASLSKS